MSKRAIAGSLFYNNPLRFMAGAPPIPASLIAWYPFNGNANDATGNGFNGTLVGSPSFVSGASGSQALQLNGSSQYMDGDSNNQLTYSPSITYNVWVNVTSFNNATSAGYQSVIDKVDNAGEGIELFVKSNGTLAMYVRTTSGNIDYDGTGTYTLTTGTWYMLTLTFTNGPGLIGYVNANVDSSNAISSNLLNFSAVTAIGYGLDTSFPNRYFYGLIQDARVYSVALTQAQISSLYSAGPQ